MARDVGIARTFDGIGYAIVHIGHHHGGERKDTEGVDGCEKKLADNVEEGLVPPDEFVSVEALLH